MRCTHISLVFLRIHLSADPVVLYIHRYMNVRVTFQGDFPYSQEQVHRILYTPIAASLGVQLSRKAMPERTSLLQCVAYFFHRNCCRMKKNTRTAIGIRDGLRIPSLNQLRVVTKYGGRTHLPLCIAIRHRRTRRDERRPVLPHCFEEIRIIRCGRTRIE